MKRYAFSELSSADLVIDATYESDRTIKNVAAEPLAKLTGTGNQGGFRYCGPNTAPKVVVLYSTIAEADWPDGLDEETGLFTYYGDNRKPGYELHDRKSGRGGNQILRRAFELAHGGATERALVPPFLIFAKGEGRDAIFKGLAVPGGAHLDPSSDLVAVWKLVDGQRFDLYEVCGQTQKSARWRDRPNRMLQHLLKRERLRLDKGMASRFEQGTAAALKKLKAGWQDYRYEYDVKIVQPGLSRRAVGEEGLHLLAGVETYLLETRAMSLKVIASE